MYLPEGLEDTPFMRKFSGWKRSWQVIVQNIYESLLSIEIPRPRNQRHHQTSRHQELVNLVVLLQKSLTILQLQKNANLKVCQTKRGRNCRNNSNKKVLLLPAQTNQQAGRIANHARPVQLLSKSMKIFFVTDITHS